MCNILIRTQCKMALLQNITTYYSKYVHDAYRWCKVYLSSGCVSIHVPGEVVVPRYVTLYRI